MRPKAVIFDLFGTLVNSFTRREYDQVNAQMAAAVSVPYPEFWQLMGETYLDSCLGRYTSYEDLVSDVCVAQAFKRIRPKLRRLPPFITNSSPMQSYPVQKSRKHWTT